MRQRVAQHAGRTTISECTPSRLTLSRSAWGKTFLPHRVQGWFACGVPNYTYMADMVPGDSAPTQFCQPET